ncbi:MAG: AAA family ATPase [Deltaproteobacteria bacterium]|nr:AAA family ATPase [Deltaproteobacteria bacterium]
MYTSYFGLKENPFSMTPDTRYLFLSPQHSEALNHLLYGINEKKGFMVITGGIGTGKTTICRKLLSVLDQSVDSALIFNPSLSEMELLAAVNQEFGVKSGLGRKTRKRYIDALNKFLLKNFSAGRNAVLLIDEAQNLSRGVLEQIRMLSNLETEREKLLQIVLVGQPELEKLLTSPSLKQLNERITVRYNLTPFSYHQEKNYIKHRLAVAGGDSEIPLFSSQAYRKIHSYSRGIPRRINAICDRALLIAYSRDSNVINRNLIREAVSDIGSGYLTDKTNSQRKIERLLLLSALIIIILLLLAVTVNSEAVFDFFLNTDFFKWNR